MTSCRFYREPYPCQGDVVVVRINKMVESGFYVSLLEYNNIQGHIPISECTRRRIQKTRKTMQKGQLEVCKVVKIDTEVGVLELVQDDLPKDKVIEVATRWNSFKTFHCIMKTAARALGSPLIDFYNSFGWVVHDVALGRTAGLGKRLLKWSKTTPLDVLINGTNDWMKFCEDFQVPDKAQNIMYHKIADRAAPQLALYATAVRVICWKAAGIDAVKRALRKGIEAGTEEFPISITLKGNGSYNVVTETVMPEQRAMEFLKDALAIIEQSILRDKGVFAICKHPAKVQK